VTVGAATDAFPESGEGIPLKANENTENKDDNTENKKVNTMDALFQASDETARSILIALCSDDRVRSKALRYLGMIEPKAKVRVKTDGALRSEPNAKKRKLDSTLSICVRCHEAFQEGTPDRCRYHDGTQQSVLSRL
jgi:hypothetical protein